MNKLPSERIKEIYRENTKGIQELSNITDLHFCIDAVMKYLDETYQQSLESHEKTII